jgi:hypothetical protein
MVTIKRSTNKLEFIGFLSPIARGVFLLFGLIPLLAPYELLIKPAWNGRVSIVTLPFIVISLGAVSVSTFFITAAFLGRNQHFQFDASNRTVKYRFNSVLYPIHEESYDFSQIETIAIEVNEWDSRPDSYDICLKIRGKREFKLGAFLSLQDAEQYLAELKNILAR